jgi:hypothetical protein
MRVVYWGVIVFFFTVLLAMVHYTLPQRDIVRVVDAYEKRMDVGSGGLFWGKADTGTNATETRDVRFIDTIRPDGSVMVYRNEDTGFSWPFYFKFDSSDLGAEAKNLISKDDDPIWVAMRHYGWRIQLFTIFPNVTSVKVVDGPDARLIPWFNIVFLIICCLILLGIFRLLQRFKRNRVDPVVDNVGEAWDMVEDRANDAGGSVMGFFGRFNRMLGRLFGSRK